MNGYIEKVDEIKLQELENSIKSSLETCFSIGKDISLSFNEYNNKEVSDELFNSVGEVEYTKITGNRARNYNRIAMISKQLMDIQEMIREIKKQNQ